MEKARLTIDVEPALRARLKIAAARRGVSMRQLCLHALERELGEEDFQPLNWKSDPVLAELWDNEEDAVYDEIFARRSGSGPVPVQRKRTNKTSSSGNR
jgi:hypothetical protein